MCVRIYVGRWLGGRGRRRKAGGLWGVKGWLRNQVSPLRATLPWMHSLSLFGVEGVTVKS